ncbi:MAG: hypothetical protein JSU69_06180 [Candidatus Zixiibacteriota bacterium]|nr:MAG: hypothetical protein JSU69_06180 [candidate division Zixibacteria bacterium]
MKASTVLITLKRRFLCSLMIAALAVTVIPDYSSAGMSGGLSFMLGFPQGEFSDNVDKTGYGVSGELAYKPRLSPFSIGGSLAYMVYGREKRTEPFSYTIPDVFVDVITTNSLFSGHILLRTEVPKGPIRPYVDGLLGFNYLFTETKIEGYSDEPIAKTTNFDDAVFSYGAGGGVLIKVFGDEAALKAARFGKSPLVFIDLRLRYLIGGEAEYLKEGSIGRVGTTVVYDVIESKTDLLTFHIGVTAVF